MGLPKVIQVTIDDELAELLSRAKTDQPLASLSKLVKRAAINGFKEEFSLVTPSEDFEELEV